MLKVIVGHSEDPDSREAIEEVLEQCLEELDDLKPQAGLLFAAIDFDYAVLLDEINRAFPGIDLIGCTTDAEISSVLGFQQNSISLTLFISDSIQIHAGIGLDTQENVCRAARQAVAQATENTTQAPKLCIALPVSYVAKESVVSGEEVLAGLDTALGSHVPIVGGAAGDRARFQKTYQFFGTQVYTNALPVLIFSGELLLSYGTGCGWEPMGRKSLITKSCGNVLYEIEGMSAIDFYKQYLGDRVPGKDNPLAVYVGDSDRYYLRVPNFQNTEDGSISFLGDIPEQSFVQLTGVSRNQIIESSRKSFEMARKRYPGARPDALLIFSCCARRWRLGTRAKEEYQLVRDALQDDLPASGFYTYGEFAPLDRSASNTFHEETFVTVLIGDA
ncbi:MAG: FIST signal transduction protein [Geitlerinemataceae cyanobacterium]